MSFTGFGGRDSGSGNGFGGREGGLFGGSVSGVGLNKGGDTGGYDPVTGRITITQGYNNQPTNPTGNNGNGGANGSGGGNGAGNNAALQYQGMSDGQLADAINKANKAKGQSYGNQNFEAAQQSIIDAAQAEQQRRSQSTQQSQQSQQQAAEAARQTAIQNEATTRQNLLGQINNATSTAQVNDLRNQLAGLGSTAPDAANLNQSVTDTLNGMYNRLTERETRQSLTDQLGSAGSYGQVTQLQNQIKNLGTLDQTAEQNQALSDRASQLAQQFNESETNSAVAGAQSKISAAVGTPVSAAQQAANTAEANRMGGFDTRSTMGKVADVARAAVGGLTVGGPIGGLIGAGAATYNSFINNTRGASSTTQTAGMDVTRPDVGNALSGMVTGGLKGAILGPAGAILGALWGGASAAGVAPTADQLKGSSPLEGGQVTNVGSAGPGQQLVNGQWVGNGNGGRDRPNSGPVVKPPTIDVGGTGTPGTPNNTGGTNGGGQSGGPNPGGTPGQAGNGAFNDYLQELRRRQMDNLLSTGAGYSGTSGTALLGRVGAAQGALGGLSGYIQSSLGGGKSLLGGAWSW